MILLSASEWGSVLLNWLNTANDFMWTYVIIVLLVFCAVYFTIRTRGVQFVLFKDMIRIMLGLDKKSKAKQAVKEGKKKKIGSFEHLPYHCRAVLVQATWPEWHRLS